MPDMPQREHDSIQEGTPQLRQRLEAQKKKRDSLNNNREVAYLIHFATPLGTSPRGMAQHYIGRTANLTRRIREHAVGVGARLPAAFARAGIGFEVTRVFYPGPNQRPSDVERSLKNQKRAKRLCPICSGANIRSTPYDRKEKEE